ncbi:hypothetical protein MASR2M29_05240 [Spirochaetota bacterium]
MLSGAFGLEQEMDKKTAAKTIVQESLIGTPLSLYYSKKSVVLGSLVINTILAKTLPYIVYAQAVLYYV